MKKHMDHTTCTAVRFGKRDRSKIIAVEDMQPGDIGNLLFTDELIIRVHEEVREVTAHKYVLEPFPNRSTLDAGEKVSPFILIGNGGEHIPYDIFFESPKILVELITPRMTDHIRVNSDED